MGLIRAVAEATPVEPVAALAAAVAEPETVYSDASLSDGEDELGVCSWGDDGCHLP